MSFLSDVIAKKKARLVLDMSRESEASLARQAGVTRPCLDFKGALLKNRPAIIGEFKRSSPSKGRIRHDRDPQTQALLYLQGGAAALSVLTEEDYFHGSAEDLQRVAAACPLPVLRKDFILHPYQLLQARVWGASAVLLITRVLKREGLADLLKVTSELGLTPLVEVGNEAELEIALALSAPLLGINNRNLETLEVDPGTTPRLLAQLPKDQLVVGESGLKTADEIRHLYQLGVSAVLIGETLMRAEDPAAELRRLRG